MRLYCGIDTGLDGAIVCIDEHQKVIFSRVTPTVDLKKKRGYDAPAMRALLRQAICGPLDDPDEPPFVALEKSGARPGQGVTSMWTTGYGFGLWEGLLAGLCCPYITPTPQSWMKIAYAGISGEGKQRSVIAAGRLLPALSLLATPRCRTPHDGLADAGLLALFALRNGK